MASENTAIVKLLENFNDFISTNKSSDSNNSLFSSKINFDQSNSIEDESNFFPKHTLQEFSELKRRLSSSRSELNRDVMNECQKTVDLICAKNTISKLENKVESVELSRKRARIEHDSEREQQELEKQALKTKAEDLQREVVALMKKQVEILDELNKCKQSASTERLASQEKLRKLQNEKVSAVNKCKQDLSSAQETIAELKSTLLKNEKVVNEVKLKNEMLSKKLQLQTNNYEESLDKLEEFQQYKVACVELTNKVKILEDTLAKQEDYVAMNRILHSELNIMKEIDKENMRLKEENRILRENRDNVLLLQEKIDGLEKALERSEKRCAVMNELQIKNDELISKLKQWENLDSISSNEKSPRKVAQYIADLQSKEAIIFNRCAELETQINVLMKTNRETLTKLSNAEEEIKLKTVKLQMSGENIKRLQKKLLLITKERDSYQHVLNSYEKEVTMNTSSVMNDRIQTLENIVEICHLQITTLEGELKTANEKLLEKLEPKIMPLEVKISQENLTALEEKTASLESQIKQLEDANKKLQEEKDSLELRLEYRALKGDYDPSSTKVVHMKFNPMSTAQSNRQDQLEELYKENQRLLERIRLLQQSSGSDISLNDSDKNDQRHNLSFNKEIESLKKQLKKAELRHQRYMEAFSEKSQEFREVVYMLFGYRVDMTNEHQYKLISMYAERAEDFFIFKLHNGELQLLETAFSNHVSYLIETHLQMHHSIPAFLSSVTLELFTQQTCFLPATPVSL